MKHFESFTDFGVAFSFQAMQSVDTGSQVCNLAWSKHSSELVSTHGYSQNQILVWKYPSLVQVNIFLRNICQLH